MKCPITPVQTDLGRTVLRDTAGPATPAQLHDSSRLGFPRAAPPRTLPQLPPPQLQTSCRPTPSQTEDFSDIIFLALLPPASPQAKKFFYQWEAESSFKNREILSRGAQGRHGRGRGKDSWLLQLEEGTPLEDKAGREMSQSPLTAASSRLTECPHSQQFTASTDWC